MGEESKRHPPLPVFGGLLGPRKRPPTLADARIQLGGAWVGGPDIGRVVAFSAATGTRTGVIIHSTPTERDVWIAEGRIQRISATEAVLSEDRDPVHEPVAADARLHASLRPGDHVAFQRPDGSGGQGMIAEKLRYGSLVGTTGGRVIAVSFRRLVPVGVGTAD